MGKLAVGALPPTSEMRGPIKSLSEHVGTSAPNIFFGRKGQTDQPALCEPLGDKWLRRG